MSSPHQLSSAQSLKGVGLLAAPLDLRPRLCGGRAHAPELGGQPANMSAAKIDWLPAEGGHGQLPQGGGGPGDVGLGVRGLRWGQALVLEELGVRGGVICLWVGVRWARSAVSVSVGHLRDT